jgi:transposase
VEVKDLVFLDEFGATTAMERTYVRGPVGERVVVKSPQSHWKTLSTIAALTVDGILGHATFEGATDTDMFVAYLQAGLLPKLRPTQVVVMDNLSVHTSEKVRQLIESTGARLLLLPPYSPDLNPIEMAISKMKNYVRSKAARDVDSLSQAISEAAESITPEDAQGFIRHCGYGATDGLKVL